MPIVISLRLLAARSTLLSLAALAAFGCGGPRGDTTPSSARAPELPFQETFDNLELAQQHWSAALPEVVGGTAGIEDGEARLTSPSYGKVALVHSLDVNGIRGKRLRVTARVRTDSVGVAAHLEVALGRSTTDFSPRARTTSASTTQSSIAAVVDVDSDVTRAELSLLLLGPGNAWFDDLKVEVLGPKPAPSSVVLSAQQLKHLQALTRAVALIRYRHPSDQAADLDWNTFFPMAIDRVMRAVDEDSLLAELRDLFAYIGPTVQFSRAPDRTFGDLPRPETGHLARWRHEGLGPHEPFKSWREGREADLASLRVETTVGDLRASVRCKKPQLRATVHDVSDDGEVRAYARAELGGDAYKRFDRKLTAADSAISLDFDMPADTYRVRLGFELRGRSTVTLEALSLACDGIDIASVDLAHAHWEQRGATDLYSWESRDCGAHRCLTVARRPLDTIFAVTRDVLNAEILDHMWIHVPVAVWTDGVRTLPQPQAWVPPTSGTATDSAERIATLASAWIVLSMFYPGLLDQKIDWAHELPGALTSGAEARSTRDTYVALSRLIAKLQDAHAGATHPSVASDAMLPIAMRKFGNKLIVIGAFGDYLKLVPIGTEVLAIDQVPAMRAYQQMRECLSSSTEGWEAWGVPLWLTRGPRGSFSTVRVRSSHDAREFDVLLPRLSRELYSSLVREPRPVIGAALAPGVHYVDLEDLKAERWQGALAMLVHARVIILDMRGYPSNVVFSMIGHFIDKEVRSPLWQIPILESSGYTISYWVINPMKPRIYAKLIVLLDGRAASAAETFLQIVHDNHLATFVGETSAGTNGVPNTTALPGGFTLRFTGVRVPFADGSALQGRGIVPDVVVHPTLEGVLGGRDEILEAGVGLAAKLIAK